MPLVKCPDCGRDVSDIAPACPNCGRPMAAKPVDPMAAAFTFPQPQEQTETKWIALAVLAVVLVSAMWWLWTKWSSRPPQVATNASAGKSGTKYVGPPSTDPFEPPKAPDSTPAPDYTTGGSTGAVSQEADGTWVEVAKWTSNHSLQTERFTITGRKWRVTWGYKLQNDTSAFLQIYGLRPHESGGIFSIGKNTNENPGSGEEEFDTTGDFYLQINSLDTAYVLTVEELRS